MKYKIITDKINNGNYIYCLGFFDGLHLGHQELINESIKLGKIQHKNVGLITFFEPPFNKENKHGHSKVLLTNEDKIDIIKNFKIDRIVSLYFDEECKKTSKEEFIKFLKTELNCVGVVVGSDYRFGYKGEGNIDYLNSLVSNDFIVKVIPPLQYNDEIISTTKIIKYLEDGNLDLVNHFLGRKYEINGVVEHGYNVGKTIDFPTANIKINENIVLPKLGVYAVNILIDGDSKVYKGVANLGIRPSINTLENPLLEVHIFNFVGNIYQEKITVKFIEFIREEGNFDSLDELKEQIQKDRQKALEIL